jgi:hypothetical protein
MDKVTDGLSNTIFFAEGYYRCKSDTKYSVSSSDPNYAYLLNRYQSYSYSYSYSNDTKRPWNYDPLGYTYKSSSTFQYVFKTVAPNKKPTYSYNSTSSYEGETYPYYSYYNGIQNVPSPSSCQSYGAQASTSAGLVVGMGDGVVRVVSPSVSTTIWYAANTPRSGESSQLP